MMSEPLWSDEQYEAYNLGAATEREHQNALSRLAIEKHRTEFAAVSAERDAALAEVQRLREDAAQLEGAVRLAYRKHHLDDESIGWDELSDALKDTLCEVWGDKLFQVWLEANKPEWSRQ